MSTEKCTRCRINNRSEESWCKPCRVQYKFDHRLKNRAHILEYRKQYTKMRVEKDPAYKLAGALRHRMYQFFKKKKSGSSVRDLGCTLDELKSYIASKFTDKMTWENYGPKGWHLDHIKPLASFDLTSRDEFLKASHYTNLQPLWWNENMKKGCKT